MFTKSYCSVFGLIYADGFVHVNMMFYFACFLGICLDQFDNHTALGLCKPTPVRPMVTVHRPLR